MGDRCVYPCARSRAEKSEFMSVRVRTGRRFALRRSTMCRCAPHQGRAGAHQCLKKEEKRREKERKKMRKSLGSCFGCRRACETGHVKSNDPARFSRTQSQKKRKQGTPERISPLFHSSLSLVPVLYWYGQVGVAGGAVAHTALTHAHKRAK